MVVIAAAMHDTVVLELHDAVVHAAEDRTVLALKSRLAMFNPLTVTDDPPLSAAFSIAFDALGASKLKSPDHVPATAPTVTKA